MAATLGIEPDRIYLIVERPTGEKLCAVGYSQGIEVRHGQADDFDEFNYIRGIAPRPSIDLRMLVEKMVYYVDAPPSPDDMRQAALPAPAIGLPAPEVVDG